MMDHVFTLKKGVIIPKRKRGRETRHRHVIVFAFSYVMYQFHYHLYHLIIRYEGTLAPEAYETNTLTRRLDD